MCWHILVSGCSGGGDYPRVAGWLAGRNTESRGGHSPFVACFGSISVLPHPMPQRQTCRQPIPFLALGPALCHHSPSIRWRIHQNAAYFYKVRVFFPSLSAGVSPTANGSCTGGFSERWAGLDWTPPSPQRPSQVVCCQVTKKLEQKDLHCRPSVLKKERRTNRPDKKQCETEELIDCCVVCE